MTAVKDFIVAIELGSSKLTGMAGKRNSDGSIQIFAYAREEASAFIRKGIIYNINKTVLGLTSIINKLEEQLEAEIAKVYVGIGGQSLHSEKNFVVEHLPRETAITPDIVNQLIANNRQTRYPDRDILDVIPQEYKVKNTNHLDPVGIISNEIEGHFLNIVARTSVKRNIITCFEQAGIEIAGFFISPLVLADAVLQENEMRLGCALIDCGADTTTVAIYKQGLLRHLAVIPLGGNNITKDICSLQIEEEEAEVLKCTYGSGFTLPDENSDDDKYPINESRNIQAKLLNEIVGARTEEIVANVRNQIMLAGYSDKLTAGYVLTGGGANLRNLQGAFMQKGKYIKIRIAGTVNMPIKATEQELYAKNGRLNTLFALVAAGKENCYRPEPVAPATDLIEQMQQKEHEEQEREAARREAEERERKEREAAAKAAAQRGMNTILSPQIPYYINRRQSKDPSEPRSQGYGTETVEAVYNYQPAKGVDASLLPYYKGVQANFWTEYVIEPDTLEYLMLPRLAAVAEAGWTPQALRRYEDFVQRLQAEADYYKWADYEYGKHVFK